MSLFAATIIGSGASTELEYVGSYTHLREDMIEWDNTQRQSTRPVGIGRRKPNRPTYRRASTSRVSSSPRARRRSVRRIPRSAGAEDRTHAKNRALALMVPVTNFGDLVEARQPRATQRPSSAPRWSGTSAASAMREIRKNAAGEYLHHRWPVRRDDHRICALRVGRQHRRRTDPARNPGSRPDRRRRVGGHHLGARTDYQRFRSRTAPGQRRHRMVRIQTHQQERPRRRAAEGPRSPLHDPHPASGPLRPAAPAERRQPQRGEILDPLETRSDAAREVQTPAPERRRRLDDRRQQPQQTANSRSTRRAEGTWKYRVKESNETAEAEFSTESEAIKVDRTPPVTPTAAALAWLRLRRATAAGTKTASRSPSPRTGTRRWPTAARRAASNPPP